MPPMNSYNEVILYSAQELSELLTKLLNKLYTQQDFITEDDSMSLASADPLATSPRLLEVL